MTTPLIETLARAIIEAQGYSPSENEMARARDEVPGIITALTEAGYAIVPVTPTEEMLEEGAHCASTVPIPHTAERIYRCMVAATPDHIMPAIQNTGPLDSEKGE